MSVLAHEEDEVALAEALAFIDEFSLPPVDADWTLWTATDAASDASSPVKKKRVRDPAADVRRRLRRKEERDALRQQVKDLERQLIKSRRAFQPSSESSDATDGDDSSTSGENIGKRVTKRTALRWHKALVGEQRRRHAAEALNTQLRNLVVAQTNTTRALQQCLQQYAQSNAPNVKPVVDLPTPCQVLSASSLPRIHGELKETAQRLYQEASSAWDPSLAVSVTSDYSVGTDRVVGTYIETRATAPLGQGMADVAALIRLAFLWNKFPMSSASLTTGKVTTLTKQIVIDLSAEGSLTRFHAVFVLRWSQEADRVVLTYSSLMFHPSGKFCFREGGWMIVQQTYANPASESSFQSCSRLASEMIGVSSGIHDDETSEAHSIGMNALRNKVKSKCERIQHRLLMETGRADLARMLPDPQDTGSYSWSSETRQQTITINDALPVRYG